MDAPPSGQMSVERFAEEDDEVASFLQSPAPGPVSAAYEAEADGVRAGRARAGGPGLVCVVAAPGKIERPAQDRVKTDRRDAERLVRLLMISGLHPVRIPSSEEEALRDLVRAREDIRGDLMRSRHRLSKLLLRHDVRYEDTASVWTAAHRAWLSRVDLGERAAQATLLDYLGAIDALVVRRDALERMIGELVPLSPWAEPVARLRCLRGIDTLSAIGLCAEIGDFARFESPAKLMHYLGLVPSESSSGQQRRCRRDHQDRLAPRTPAARRGGLALPPPTPQGHHAPAPPTRPTRTGARDLMESPAAPPPHLAAPRPSAASARRSSRSPSPATSPASAGRSPITTTPTLDPTPTPRPSAESGKAASALHAREHPRSSP